MAYAAVASLLQTLDYLMKFPCLIYEIKKIQGRKFLTALQEFPSLSSRLIFLGNKIRGGEVPEDLHEYSTLSSRLHRLIAQTEPLAYTTEDFVRAVGLSDLEIKKLFFLTETPTPLVEEEPAILQELQVLDQDLNTFVDLYVQDIIFQILNDQKSPPEEAKKMVMADRRITKDITCFWEVCRRATDFHRHIRFLLTKLEDLQNAPPEEVKKLCMDWGIEEYLTGPPFLRTNLDDSSTVWPDLILMGIRDCADRARKAVELMMVNTQIESAMSLFEAIFRINPTARALGTNAFENEIKNWFYPNEHTVISEVKFFCSLLDELTKINPPAMFVSDGINKVQTKTIKGETRNMNNEILSLEFSATSVRDLKEETVAEFDEEPRILEELVSPSELRNVTIVGMGGIGKTTLAKKLFNDPYIINHFEPRAWIKISHDYQLRDLLIGLLTSVTERSDKMKSNAQLAEDLRRSLIGKKYLIVMDNMWSINAWNDVKECFPDDTKGSRIIVTTRSTELAENISSRRPHFMNLMETQKSWELLKKLVFGNACCSPELAEVGKQIAERCGGLRLTIVATAGILSRNVKALDLWKNVAENLISMVSTDPEQCLDILALSYLYLPHHLRACLLYMVAFPEDCDIAAAKLINLWVAEGFIVSDNPKNLEQIAEGYLQDLISRNLVLVEKRSFGGKVKSCRLHDFTRELCLREAQKENFMKVIQRGSSGRLSASMLNPHRLSLHLDPYINGDGLPILELTSSFLCFNLGSDRDVLFIQLGFKLLNVLDVYFWHFEHFPEVVLTLIHLRYLALNVTFELPASISKLRNLQTFVIQGPWPSGEFGNHSQLLLEYWKMPSLRHVFTSMASQLWNPPVVQDNLPLPFSSGYLQTLSTIRFSSCTKEVLSIMPCLKRLGICETKDDYMVDRSCYLLNNIVCLRELETLKCCFYKQNREVRHLCCMYSFPSTLRRLSISWSYLPWEDMTSIAMLPNLEVLKLKHYAFQGPKWLPIKEGFRSLKHLLIENINLVHWVATVHQFPCLQNLILKFCKHLEEIPFSVEQIGSLQRIEVHYCSEPIEILAKEIQEQVEGVDAVIRSDRAPDLA